MISPTVPETKTRTYMYMHARTNSCKHAYMYTHLQTTTGLPQRRRETMCPRKAEKIPHVPKCLRLCTKKWAFPDLWLDPAVLLGTRYPKQGCCKHKQMNCGNWITHKWLISSPLLSSFGIKSTGIKEHRKFKVSVFKSYLKDAKQSFSVKICLSCQCMPLKPMGHFKSRY